METCFKIIGSNVQAFWQQAQWCSNRGPGEAATKGSFHHYSNSKGPQQKLYEKATSHKVNNGFTVDLMCYRYYHPLPFPPSQHYADLLEFLFWYHSWQDENYFQLLCQTERNYLLFICVFITLHSMKKYIFTIFTEMRLTNFHILNQNRYIFLSTCK